MIAALAAMEAAAIGSIVMPLQVVVVMDISRGRVAVLEPQQRRPAATAVCPVILAFST